MNSKKVSVALKDLLCIVNGSCLCDLCDTWDDNVFVSFSLGRTLVPSFALYLMKLAMTQNGTWTDCRPYYMNLYGTLNEDIDPMTSATLIDLDTEIEAWRMTLDTKPLKNLETIVTSITKQKNNLTAKKEKEMEKFRKMLASNKK